MEKPDCIENGGIRIANATRQGYLFCPVGGLCDTSYPKSMLRRGRVQHNGMICPTITRNPDNLWILEKIDEDGLPVFRKLSARECFRLMGVREKDIDKIESAGLSQNQMKALAGNSIVTECLTDVFRTMFIEDGTEEPDGSSMESAGKSPLF